MGDYTKLDLKCKIKDNSKVINIIKRMIDGDDDVFREMTNEHEFFRDVRADLVFHCGSAYFEEEPFAELSEDNVLECSFNLKNYTSTIEKFLNWLAPYIETMGDIGEYHYEYSSPRTVLHTEDGGIWYK